MALIPIVGSGSSYQSATISSGISFVGAINGVNLLFVPAVIPHQVFVGGVLQKPGTDYSIVGTSVSFTKAPPTTDDAGVATWMAMY